MVRGRRRFRWRPARILGLLAFFTLWCMLPAVLHADPQPAAARIDRAQVAAHTIAPPKASRRPVVEDGVIIVQPGDTLWTLASRLAPDEDPRAWIADVRRENHLSTVVIKPGQRLRLPVGPRSR
ncbi:MAG: LysM peptidoglycan-binding domain-containing protein [Clostridia bacterium]|nr:LysM peptidoglycan-binding domain-containing protein [Clostridia bacterium]